MFVQGNGNYTDGVMSEGFKSHYYCLPDIIKCTVLLWLVDT